MEPHKSWLDLTPQTDESGNPEWFENYYERIDADLNYQHIPRKVLEQWIHAHYDHPEMIKNYGWINYNYVKFRLIEIPTPKLIDLNVLESFKGYVNIRSSYKEYSEFCCVEQDLYYWKNEGTWRTPPVVLNVESFQNPPKDREISGPLQLIEGHSRLGYLNSALTASSFEGVKIRPKHKVYLLEYSKHNN